MGRKQGYQGRDSGRHEGVQEWGHREIWGDRNEYKGEDNRAQREEQEWGH